MVAAAGGVDVEMEMEANSGAAVRRRCMPSGTRCAGMGKKRKKGRVRVSSMLSSARARSSGPPPLSTLVEATHVLLGCFGPQYTKQ